MTNETRVAEMRRKRDDGYSDAEIGARYGMSRAYVHKLLGPFPVDRRKGARLPTGLPAPAAAPGMRGLSADDIALPGELRDWRLRNSLTQQQAREILGLASVVSYSKWENGHGCSLSTLVRRYLKLWERYRKDTDKDNS